MPGEAGRHTPQELGLGGSQFFFFFEVHLRLGLRAQSQRAPQLRALVRRRGGSGHSLRRFEPQRSDPEEHSPPALEGAVNPAARV